MKTGLYFGSFNPIHIGHLIIANYMVEHSALDEIWLVVTPQNPLKIKNSLLKSHHRFELVRLATEGYLKIKPTDIEFKLPQPNYTISTLAYITEKYSKRKFCLVIGEDNLKSFDKWKNFETIIENYQVYVYPRICEGKLDQRFKNHKNIHKVDAPVVQISSKIIRKDIKDRKNVRPLLPEEVWKYIDEMNFYKK